MDEFEIRTFWDAEANGFDAEVDHGLTTPEARSAWWELMRDLLPPAPSRVADLGCGTGSLSVLLAEHGYDVVGTDLSPAMIQHAKRKADAHGLVIDFDVGDASQPDLRDGTFDVVLARHLAWALPDPSTALDAWFRLLRPDGRAVLIEGRWSTNAGLTADELTALVEPAARVTEVRQLTNASLWGHEITDERYALVARH